MTNCVWCLSKVDALIPPVVEGYFGRCPVCYDPITVLVSDEELKDPERMRALKTEAIVKRAMLRINKVKKSDAWGPTRLE